MFAQRVPSVSPAEVPEGAFLLDVREEDEWAAGHAPEAVHVPMMQVPARMVDLPQDTDVVVVCRSGARSGRVTSYLLGNGWSAVYNLDGGMQAWAAAGKPVQAAGGGPGAII